ncbi:MAG: lipase family protein [Betaproteobacteria bacterium]
MDINHRKLAAYAWLSQASYRALDNLSGNQVRAFIEKLTTVNDDGFSPGNVFTQQQADSLTDSAIGYSFVNQYPNDAAGFSATVFRSNENGSYTIAVRGTEPTRWNPSDLLVADLEIGLLGKAREQTIAAYRYYKQLTTVPGQSVSYTTQEKLLLAGLYTGSFAPILTSAAYLAVSFLVAGDVGLGVGDIPMIPHGSTINFTGHSLGGHVATLLAQLVAKSGIGDTGEIFTYNAPGTGGIVAELLSWCGIDGSDPTMAAKIINIVADGGISITATLGSKPGANQDIVIEKELNPITNHLIFKLSDSLALQETLAKLDPSLSTATLNRLFKSVSNIPESSFERALNPALRLFDITALLEIGGSRDAFYQAMGVLSDRVSTAGISNPYKLVSFSDMDANSVAVAALADTASGLAYRYALATMSPYAVLNFDYAPFSQQELALYNEETGEGALSKEYLTDKALYLSWQLAFNQADRDYSANGRDLLQRAFNAGWWYDEHFAQTTRDLYTAGEDGKDVARKGGIRQRLSRRFPDRW